MPLSRNLGTLTSWNPLGLSRPVMGLLYLLYFTNTYSEYVKLIFLYYNVGFTNAPDCYVIQVRTLPVVLAYFPIFNCISFVWYQAVTSKSTDRISLNVVSTLCHCCEGEDTVCSYPRRKAYRGSGGIAPVILNLDARWLIYPPKEALCY